MVKNIIKRLFRRYRRECIKYSVSGDFLVQAQKFPKILFPKGTNEVGYLKFNPYPCKLINFAELNIGKKDLDRASELALKDGFFLDSQSEQAHVFFGYDKNLGLIKLILNSGEKNEFRVDKKKMSFFTGKLVCFLSPEGGGKTSLLSATNTVLQKYPPSVMCIHFGCLKESKIYRAYDLFRKILQVHWNNLLGRITLTDRYIYLTFNQNNFLRKLIRFVAPTPDIVFVMKADYKTLKKRRGPLCPPKKQVNEIYEAFSKIEGAIEIDSKKPLEYNIQTIISKILEVYSENGEKYFSYVV